MDAIETGGKDFSLLPPQNILQDVWLRGASIPGRFLRPRLIGRLGAVESGQIFNTVGKFGDSFGINYTKVLPPFSFGQYS